MEHVFTGSNAVSIIAGSAPIVTLGQRICDAEGLDFAETFLRQFVISRRPVAVPEGWASVSIGAWRLDHCPALSTHRLLSAGGDLRAIVLGIALVPGFGALAEPYVVPDDPQELEQFIEGLAGRYIVLTHDRLYVDPCASLLPMYDPQTHRIAGCIPLVLDRPVAELPSLPMAKHRAADGHHYLFGDTVDEIVRRMLANHYLDLTDFTLHRHWPKAGMSFETPDAQIDLIEDVLTRLSANIGALTKAHRCLLPVTGGYDSRVLLACARESLDRMGPLYCFNRNAATFVDTVIGQAIAERLGVPFQIVSRKSLPVKELTGARVAAVARMIELRANFQYQPDSRTVRAHEIVPPGDVILRGAMVELTRAHKWRNAWGPVVTPELGMRALAVPGPQPEPFTAQSIPRYAAWQETLPEEAQDRAMDFAHTELWLPTTQHTATAGYANRTILFPMNDRKILQSVASMTYAYRRKMRFQNYAIRSRMPEIQDIPYRSKPLADEICNSDLLQTLGRR